MQAARQKLRQFYASSISLVIFLSLSQVGCQSLRQPPKVTKCLIDQKSGGLQCINSQGTEFFISFDSRDSDKHVCIPGKQFVDASAWLQELLIYLTKGAN